MEVQDLFLPDRRSKDDLERVVLDKELFHLYPEFRPEEKSPADQFIEKLRAGQASDIAAFVKTIPKDDFAVVSSVVGRLLKYLLDENTKADIASQLKHIRPLTQGRRPHQEEVLRFIVQFCEQEDEVGMR